ncbi:hypothetical protein TVNIR_2969 [Thioalkalivibrio nitratireducens DSM 14787]|uniref:DUF4412 domain-containing protein n=1 Tax=Thioalkalivibrio nitratireducens (strain DSM 14787 / UNIQEM 213 / ALEN2) TaxID=1255043 RepID=L0E1U5_THIND|nr:hypothetical protein [Thioalkalivibrio nitratireducens]AGA34606.1 hypothetical protein TVNIR_2969 [Thioalkalivibrio nitratireducens DSM 14787]
MLPRPFLTAALGLLLVCIPGIASADAVLRFVDSHGEHSQMLVKAPYARMDIVNGGSGHTGYMLFYAEDRSLYVVDDGSGTYMPLNEDVIDAQKRAMDEMIDGMRSRIQQLPPEARAEMERQFGIGVDAGPVEVSAQPTGREQDLNGLRCQEKEILVAGRVQHVACVADAETLGLSPVDFETISALMERLFDLSKRALDAGGPIAMAMGSNVIPRLDGVPLTVRDVRDGVTTRLTGISTDPISPELFRVPASYREQAPF